MATILREHLAKRRSDKSVGIPSVCSAHPWVIEAAAAQAKEDESLLLIEATSNQVNQFGGYTGMRPAAFRTFVLGILEQTGCRADRLILGGDHLGPNPWRTEAAALAMPKAEVMVAEYVEAGFTKIHLDASMALCGDPSALSDELVAERAVALCKAAEKAARSAGTAPLYVIGTEVPTPGGADHALATVEVTTPAAAERTLATHKRAFLAAGLEDAWARVIGLVVQPGVEFDHNRVVDYRRDLAQQLSRWLTGQHEGVVFEAHSTDYQRPQAYGEMVEDGFAILKVGPALTFAMREALYALADIEAQLAAPEQQSGFIRVVESTMLEHPAAWQPYYHGTAAEQRLLRVYSYSDRIRYYWHRPEIAAAVESLIGNLEQSGIPETILSRYLPAQYERVRQQRLAPEPAAIIVDKIRDVLRVYGAACRRPAGT